MEMRIPIVGDANIPLLAAKSVHLPVGRAPSVPVSLEDGTLIRVADSSKDLGILVTSSFKTYPCRQAV